MVHLPGILKVFEPTSGLRLPILADSPHSGRNYPPDFRFTCDKEALELYEDRFVDELIAGFPALGATVVTAEAPRTYIDLNRRKDDISARFIDDPYLNPTAQSMRGTGLIWEKAWDELIYAHDGYPTPEDIHHRIKKYYDTYYNTLHEYAAQLRARFGTIYHLNFHSMPGCTNGGKTKIILGDLEGETCSPEFREMVTQAFQDQKLSVGHNEPYKGVNLVTLFGQPLKRRESLQIEISKDLYLKHDELTKDPEKFSRLQEKLENVLKVIGNYALAPKTLSNTARKAASSSSIETRLPSAASEVTP